MAEYTLLIWISGFVQEQAAKLKDREITQEDYDRWRYHYPDFDDTSIRVPIPAEEPTRSRRGRKPKNKD